MIDSEKECTIEFKNFLSSDRLLIKLPAQASIISYQYNILVQEKIAGLASVSIISQCNETLFAVNLGKNNSLQEVDSLYLHNTERGLKRLLQIVDLLLEAEQFIFLPEQCIFMPRAIRYKTFAPTCLSKVNLGLNSLPNDFATLPQLVFLPVMVQLPDFLQGLEAFLQDLRAFYNMEDSICNQLLVAFQQGGFAALHETAYVIFKQFVNSKKIKATNNHQVDLVGQNQTAPARTNLQVYQNIGKDDQGQTANNVSKQLNTAIPLNNLSQTHAVYYPETTYQRTTSMSKSKVDKKKKKEAKGRAVGVTEIKNNNGKDNGQNNNYIPLLSMIWALIAVVTFIFLRMNIFPVLMFAKNQIMLLLLMCGSILFAMQLKKSSFNFKNLIKDSEGNKDFPNLFKRQVAEENQTVLLDVDEDNYQMAVISEGMPGTALENEGLRAFILLNEFIIGRDEAKADFFLKDKTIGRCHARISKKQGSFFITDLGSKNGTCLDGRRLNKNEDYLLPDRCRIQFADRSFYFQTD